MNPIDKEMTISRYAKRFEKFGHDVRTLGWGGGIERQQLRFDIIMESQNFISTPIKTVLDVGCGFGDMGAYLNKTHPNINYTGIDINPLLIQEGLTRFPGVNLICADVNALALEKFDLVCACGIFNFELQNCDHLNYIYEMLDKFNKLSTKVVVVDFMSTYVDFTAPGGFHMPEEKAIEFSKKISRRFVLRNDYTDFEYAIYILKQ